MKNIVLAILCLFSFTASAGIINLDASSSSVARHTISLSAGIYKVEFIGIADGGKFDAWSAWSSTAGCDSNGLNCGRGFLNTAFFNSAQFARVRIGGYERYLTSALALSNAEGTTFELNTAGNVQFYISDTHYGDNRGGLSLRVTQVPEPSTLILFAVTVLMMLRVRKS